MTTQKRKVFVGGKLVRDRIPEIIRQDGKEVVCSVARDEEYESYLIEKMIEGRLKKFLKEGRMQK